MDDRGVVRVGARVFRGVGAAAIDRVLLVGLLVAHEARSANGFEVGGGARDGRRVEVVGRLKRSARATEVDVVDLRERHQVVEGVALQCFAHLQADQFGGLREQRVEDGHLGNVGDDDLVTPLLADSRHLTDRQRLAERGADAFRKRLVGQRDAVVAGCGVGGAPALLKAQRVAELIRDKLAPRERESFFLDERDDVRREVRRSVITGHCGPLSGHNAPLDVNVSQTFPNRRGLAPLTANV